MNVRNLLFRLERMPMLKALVPFAAGIFLSGFFTLPLWFLAGVFVCLGSLSLLLRSQTCTLVLLLTAGLGMAQLSEHRRSVPQGVHTLYQIEIQGIPADRGSYTSAEAVVRAWRNPLDGTWHAAEDRIILRTDSLTELPLGGRFRCTGRIRPFRGPQSYRTLMSRRGYAGSLYIRERNILEQLPANAHTLHARAVIRLERMGLQGDASALTRAMTAGDKSGITPELRAAYSRSGFAHLLAVSGLHTGIVFGLINVLLWWLPLLRRGHLARNLLAATAIWLFVAAAGFPPSAVRAAVMCTFVQFALASSSEYVALNALSTAAFGMLLWNPAWLGDISFQLSVLAVAGILIWGIPLCRKLHTPHRSLNLLLNALAISLVASAATMPLVSHTFGVIPLAGVLINPLAILLGTVVVLTGTIWMIVPLTLLAPIFRFVAGHTAETLNALARFTASLPGGTLEYSLGTSPTAALYLFFAAMTLILWSVEPKKSVHLPAR